MQVSEKPNRPKNQLLVSLQLSYSKPGVSVAHFRNLNHRSVEEEDFLETPSAPLTSSSVPSISDRTEGAASRCCERQPRKHFVGYGASLD